MLELRVIDTGLRNGRWQMAFTAALADGVGAGTSPDTLRFFAVAPSVLIGVSQGLAREVDIAHCEANAIDLVRRTTGGGAVYIDEGQVVWELVLRRGNHTGADLQQHTAGVCQGIAHRLAAAFGLDVAFRPPGDLIVGGVKIGGTGGMVEPSSVALHGTVVVTMDVAEAARALTPAKPFVPVTSLAALIGAAPHRARVMTCVTQGIAAALDRAIFVGAPTDVELALADRLHAAEIGTDAFVLGSPV
jgi:lipoate-protein ligase A